MRRRILLAPFILLAILTPAYFLVGISLAEGRTSTWLALLVPFVLVASLPATWFMRDREPAKIMTIYSELTYFCMGAISFILVGTIFFDAIKLTFMHTLSPNCVYGFTALALAFGWYWAASGPRKKLLNLKIANLPSELEGLRIVQFSDLHVSRSIRLPYVKRAVKIANDFNADIVALTGDIGDGNVKDYLPEIAELKNLKSTKGIFSAPGNHEYYWDLNDWLNALTGVGAKNLLNEGQTIDVKGRKVFIGGVADPAAGQVGKGAAPDLKASIRGSENSIFKILLAHRPGFANDAAELGYDLQLSGHTHGGQFFPWNLAVHFVHHPAIGAHLIKKMWVYVSAGTGSWGPVLRLGTTPEVSCITLSRA